MTKLTLDISMSLDGFVAGANPTHEEPLGEGGNLLHEWAMRTAKWREQHGRSGEAGADGETSADEHVAGESLGSAGAVLMGRKMFSGGEGPWGENPFEGWWGDDPPFHMPVFVLTHHAREPLHKQGGNTFTFVTDGIESALEQARAAAVDKDVFIAGGADVAQQYLKAGLLDELQVHLVPVLLGAGTRLFDRLGAEPPRLERVQVIDSPAVTHLKYRRVG